MNLEDEINQIVNRVVEEAAKYAAAELRKRCPPERRKTLQAIYQRSQGSVAVVGLRFAVRYASRNTETGRWMRNEWDAIRPQVRKRIILALNAGFQELTSER
jgi:uncharacterized protein YraI